MYISKRTNKNGTYFSFSYDDPKTGKRVRLKKSEHPHFEDLTAARQWAKSQDALRQSQKDRVAKKLAWKSQFYEFGKLVEKFTEYQKREAPNSYESAVYYLEHYALHFFLDKKKQNNVNGWHFLFNEFRTWLETEATTLQGTKFAYSSCNKAIHAVNSFLTFLCETGLMDKDAAHKCKAFPDALLNSKTFESVISEQEFKAIRARLAKIDPPTADFWCVLYHTGMRFNEAYGLPMSFLFAGKAEGTLHEELTQQKINYYGYIVLESQTAGKFRKREKNGSIKRKPLKGRAKIHPKNNRIIPVADKETWNILAKRFKAQKSLFSNKAYGTDPVNYLLFQDANYSKLKRSLDKAYEGTSYTAKTFHDCRHTYCTNMVGRTRSFFLARAVLGHKSNAFERYLHIFEQMSLKAKQNEQDIEEIA